MKKIISAAAAYIILLPGIMPAAVHGLSGTEEQRRALYGAEGKEVVSSEKIRENESAPVDNYRAQGLINLQPGGSQSVNSAGVLLFDLMVPGGGHFYRGDYFNGILFVSLKVPAWYSLYYFYKEMDYRESLYVSAQKASSSLDPHRELYFRDPSGGYKTSAEFKREYERASQNFVFSAAANLLIGAVSLIVNINALDTINEAEIPSFYYSTGTADQAFEHRLTVRYDLRF